MQRPTPLVLLAGAAVSALVAWRLGGPEGAGVIAGFLCGGSIAALCAARLCHATRRHPERLMRVAGEGFLVKLALVLMGGLAFRFVEPAASRVDWQAFLVSYALSVLVVATVATLSGAGGITGKGRGSAGSDLLEETPPL